MKKKNCKPNRKMPLEKNSLKDRWERALIVKEISAGALPRVQSEKAKGKCARFKHLFGWIPQSLAMPHCQPKSNALVVLVNNFPDPITATMLLFLSTEAKL